jgi:hypothetical protein
MAVITGTLLDFSLDALAPYSPRLFFCPSGPSTAGPRLLATRPFGVHIDPDGSFSVDVQPTDTIIPAAYYTVRVEWLDSDGGFVGVDFPDWRIYVPSEGGAIGDLLRAPSNPASVWVDLEPPPAPVAPGTWWLRSSATNPDDPRNTGYLYEWS